MKIFVFGNPLLKEDSLPLKILPQLQKKFPQIKFISVDPNEDWLGKEKEPAILDVVKGIRKVSLFNSLKNFAEARRKITPHDYDLLMDLKFLKKLGKIKKVKIIGLPEKANLKQLLNQTEKLIKAI